MENFISLNEWLNEQKSEPTYGCVMMDAKIPDWNDKHAAGIDPKDVYIKPYDESYGIEDNPHVTVIYGIHEDEIDPEIIHDVIQNEMKPVTVTIDNISMFPGEEYEVVKYDVPVTDQLKKYRERFEKNFPNTQKFPEYHPHMTLAYVKPGQGQKYVKQLEEPFEVTFDKGVYSFHDDEGESVRKQHVFPKEDE
ncbi:MAG TPA: 2'-5' RNA ligase family protein [Candidatus Bathyarchaeia archaeon]|nr:2'-5' RNA ligase family protein [Candidatus Bathyarchaeia archaeon]